MLDMQEGPGPRTALPERFPEASPDALDLLSKMLTFDPSRRISVRDAMRHPWLARFYQVRRSFGFAWLGLDRFCFVSCPWLFILSCFVDVLFC